MFRGNIYHKLFVGLVLVEILISASMISFSVIVSSLNEPSSGTSSAQKLVSSGGGSANQHILSAATSHEAVNPSIYNLVVSSSASSEQ